MSAIREARISKGMSQKELARTVGIDARTLRKIENGEHVSDISKRAVERALRVSTQEAVPVAASAPLGRQFFWKYWGAVATMVTALVGGANLLIDKPFDGGVYGGIGVVSLLIVFFAFGFFAVMVAPVRGNTRIEILVGSDGAVDVSNLIEDAKGWLGRQNVTLGQISTDNNGFRFHVFSDFEVREYPALVAKLRDFGLEASIHRIG